MYAAERERERDDCVRNAMPSKKIPSLYNTVQFNLLKRGFDCSSWSLSTIVCTILYTYRHVQYFLNYYTSWPLPFSPSLPPFFISPVRLGHSSPCCPHLPLINRGLFQEDEEEKEEEEEAHLIPPIPEETAEQVPSLFRNPSSSTTSSSSSSSFPPPSPPLRSI